MLSPLFVAVVYAVDGRCRVVTTLSTVGQYPPFHATATAAAYLDCHDRNDAAAKLSELKRLAQVQVKDAGLCAVVVDLHNERGDHLDRTVAALHGECGKPLDHPGYANALFAAFARLAEHAPVGAPPPP